MFLFRLPRLAAALWLSVTVLSSTTAHAHEEQHYDLISLQVQAQRDVPHDVMRVTLYSDMQDSDPAALATKTTRILNAATMRARQVSGVTLQTGSRSSTPVYSKDRRRVVAWRERAELRLESGDFPALAALAAQLQGDLQFSSQHFLISKASRKTAEDSLIREAIAEFRERAQRVAEAFDAKSYRLVSLNLDNVGFRPVVMRQRMDSPLMSSSASAESQQIEAGSSVVSVTASGMVEIQR